MIVVALKGEYPSNIVYYMDTNYKEEAKFIFQMLINNYNDGICESIFTGNPIYFFW